MVRRAQHDNPIADIMAGFDAAKDNKYRRKRTGYAPGGSHADYHYRSDADYLRMMEIARDMERNDAMVSHLFETSTNLTLMGGIDVQAQTGDDDLDKALEEEWTAWATTPDRCDAAGELTFFQLQKLAYRQSLCDGDIFAILTDEGTIQHIEAHRVRTPTRGKKDYVHGVQLDNRRRRTSVLITKEEVDPNSQLKVGEVVPYDVRDEHGRRVVLQIYDPKRVSQTRGVTALVPIFNTCHQFEDINFATLVKQQVASCWAILRERSQDYYDWLAAGGDDGEQTGARTTTTRRDGSRKVTEGISPGMDVPAGPGEKITGFSPQIPSNEFLSHMRLTLQTISINLGVPLIVLLMDASETNFSGWRGAFDVGKQHWRDNQERVCTQYVGPTWDWFVARQIAAGGAIAKLAAKVDPRKVYGRRYHLPAWPYVDPLKDVTTDLLRKRNLLTSPQRLAAERNDDAFQIMRESLKFHETAIREAIAITDKVNKDFSENKSPVTWRDLYSLPTAEGVQVAINASQDSGNGGTKPNAA